MQVLAMQMQEVDQTRLFGALRQGSEEQAGSWVTELSSIDAAIINFAPSVVSKHHHPKAGMKILTTGHLQSSQPPTPASFLGLLIIQPGQKILENPKLAHCHQETFCGC